MIRLNKKFIVQLFFLLTFCSPQNSFAQSFDAFFELTKKAYNYSKKGDYLLALRYFNQALNLYGKDSFGKDETYIDLLNNLAKNYYYTNQFDSVETICKEKLSIYESGDVKKYPGYYKTLFALGMTYYVKGNFDKTEQLLLEAKSQIKSVKGEKSEEYATILGSVGFFYYNMGRYKKAEELNLASEVIYKKCIKQMGPGYASTLNNLAILYDRLNQPEKADYYQNRALTFYESLYGEKSPEYAIGLSNLAKLYIKKGKYNEAEKIFSRALKIKQNHFGRLSPATASSLGDLSDIYYLLGNYEKAIKSKLEAMEIVSKTLGKEHPMYANELLGLAALYNSRMQYEKSEPLIIESDSINVRLLKRFFTFLSENEKNELIKQFASNAEQNHSFVLLRQKKNPAITALSYNNELVMRGIVLESSQGMRQNVLNSLDPSLKKIFREWLGLREILSSLKNPEKGKRSNVADSIEELANTYEKQLMKNSILFEGARQSLTVQWQDIQKKLKNNEAALEFINFRYTIGKRITDSIFYCALILRNDFAYPKIVPLFEERALSELLHETGRNFQQLYAATRGTDLLDAGIDSYKLSGSLYRLIMKPIDSLLNNINTIYYVPSGLLHRISFPAIAIDSTRRLADKYNLTCLSSSRNLVIAQQDEKLVTPNFTVALFGGINYKWNSKKPQRIEKSSGDERSELRSASLPIDNVRNSTFSFLPGSLREVEAIDEKCRNLKIRVQLDKDYAASEEKFKELSGELSPTIIHVSTHGYFFDDPINDNGNNQMINSAEQSYRYSEDPLLRSGLAFAGADFAWGGGEVPEGMENGILQAKEVANMDLRNTKLVVLSACETGLGDVKGSEGVFGLQRSFKMAGVRYILMSLWQVPDEATQQLMTIFYENLFNGQPIREAFINAQKKLRQLKKEYQDPYYWAAWVLLE